MKSKHQLGTQLNRPFSNSALAKLCSRYDVMQPKESSFLLPLNFLQLSKQFNRGQDRKKEGLEEAWGKP